MLEKLVILIHIVDTENHLKINLFAHIKVVKIVLCIRFAHWTHAIFRQILNNILIYLLR